MGLLAHIREQLAAIRRTEDRWRGGEQEVTRSGRRVVLLPDCVHVWEYVGGNPRTATGAFSRCSLCRCSRVTFEIGDLHPGERAEIGFRFR